MTRKNVKILMLQKDVDFSVIAQKFKVNPQSVYFVACGRSRSKRIEAALEEALGLPIQQIREAWNNVPAKVPA